MAIDPKAWLVVIDHQRIFADPSSDWCAPRFAETVDVVQRLADAFGDRTIVTRWLPGTDRRGSWGPYFERWTFADRPDDDPVYELVDSAKGLSDRPSVDVTTFGKWGPELREVVGDQPHLVLVGVATDCCVISTALAAADAGATVTVVRQGCAGATDETNAAALQVMDMYQPMITVVDAEALLD